MLLNNRRDFGEEPRRLIRFIYLLRDDIFLFQERIKFFDFIILVMPIIDASNSYDKFIEMFQASGLYEKLDSDFMSGLSLYVDDMRLLKNIYNEF